ncbi:MAG: DNA polymerase IV [Actinomycetota bacterium]|nr:DNA polymerase IV [Actinomycetota bacterium]
MERLWDAGRAILHADLDCFFAAVEILDNPRLKGLPVIVGGTGPRGVVAAASYEARIWGVRSAMATAQAKRLCPQGVFLDGTYSRYAEVSKRFHSVLRRFTDEVEAVGLDEAFLDVSGCLQLFGPPQVIASEIRRLVGEELGLSVCVGVGTTKQVAKLASRRAKPMISAGTIGVPKGVVVVWPTEEQEFLDPISVRELWGVGPKTYQHLKSIGVERIVDLRRLPDATLVGIFGRVGARLRLRASGNDSDMVISGSRRKSIGREQTYPTDIYGPEQIDRELVRLADSVANRMRIHNSAGKTITLKLRFGDFRTITRSVTLASATDSKGEILGHLRRLFPEGANEHGIRLLGVALSNLRVSGVAQLRFDDGYRSEREEELAKSVAKIRERFGSSAISPASLIDAAETGMRKERYSS